MSRSQERSIEHRLDDIEDLADRLEVVHVSTEIVIIGRAEPWADELLTVADVERLTAHDPVDRETGEYLTVEVLERRRDLDLLLDPRTGVRRLRHLVEDVEGFDRIAAKAKSVKIPITVHEAQLDALLSEAAITAVLGGNRAGKTRVGLWWLGIRQWMLRGHGAANGEPAALFWLLAPDLKRAWKRLVKDLAPLIPRALRVGRLPKSHRSALVITMIDGSTIEALHTNEDGGNLKSENVAAILFDEAGESADEGNWQQVNSRVSQKGAPVFLPTTPVPGHWAYRLIVLQEPHAGGRIAVYHVDLFDNPWLTMPRIWSLLLSDATLTQAELEEHILLAPDPAAACRAIVQSPRALREHFGVWTVDGIKLWSEWTEGVARECTRAGGGLFWLTLETEAHGELVNLTPTAASTFFHELEEHELAQVFGEDFNLNPQTCVRAQVMGRPDDLSTWSMFFLEEIQTQGSIEQHGARMQIAAPGAAISCDPSGDIPRRKQQHEGEGDEAGRMRAMGFVCKSAVGRGHRLKSQKPTINLIQYLMRSRRFYVHLRCRELLRALQTQTAKPDGRIDKRAGSNSPTDALSSPTDAARYITWPLFKHAIEEATIIKA